MKQQAGESMRMRQLATELAGTIGVMGSRGACSLPI